MAPGKRSDPPRRTPRQERSQKKVVQILAAARKILITEGAAAFNTNRIAAEAGVGIGSLYEYFPNKDAIVDRLIEDRAAQEAAVVLARLAEVEDRNTAEAIEAIVDLVLLMYRDNNPIYRVLWAMSRNPREVGHRPGERLILDEIRRRVAALDSATALPDADLTAYTVFHIVDSMSEQMAAGGIERWGRRACGQELVTVVLRYLGLQE